MKQIRISNGLQALVDDDDFERLSKYRWQAKRSYAGNWYAYRVTSKRINGKRRQKYQAMHRLIVGAGGGEIVDHRNGNGLDNRRSNLRVCTNSQNQQNQRRVCGASKYKGVCLHRATNKWQAKINVAGKSIYLGLFATEEEAAGRYDLAAIEYFGVFAATNSEIAA